MSYLVLAILVLVCLSVISLTLWFASLKNKSAPAAAQHIILLGKSNGVLQTSHETPLLTNEEGFVDNTLSFTLTDEHVGNFLYLPKMMTVNVRKSRGRLPNVQVNLNENVKLGHSYTFVEPQSSINKHFKLKINSSLPFLFKNKLFLPSNPQRGHRKLGFSSTRGIYMWQLPGEGHVKFTCKIHPIHGQVYEVECPGRNFRGDDDSVPPTFQNLNNIYQSCQSAGGLIFSWLSAPETAGASAEAAEAHAAEEAAENSGVPSAVGGAVQTLKDFANCGSSIYRSFECLFGGSCGDSEGAPPNPPLTNQDIINDVNKVFQFQQTIQFSQSLNYTYQTVFGSRNQNFSIEPSYAIAGNPVMPAQGFDARHTIPDNAMSLYPFYYSNQFNNNINDFEDFDQASFSFYKKEYAEQDPVSSFRPSFVFSEVDGGSFILASSPHTSDPGLVSTAKGYRASLTALPGPDPTFGFFPSSILTDSTNNDFLKFNGCVGPNNQYTNSVICNGLLFAQTFFQQVSSILANRSSQNTSGGLLCSNDLTSFSGPLIPCPDYIASVLPSYINIMRYYFNLLNDMAQFNTFQDVPFSVMLAAPGPSQASTYNVIQSDAAVWLRNAMLMYYLQRQKYLLNVYWETSTLMITNAVNRCDNEGAAAICNPSGNFWFPNNANCSNAAYFSYVYNTFNASQVDGSPFASLNQYNRAYSLVNGNYNSFSSTALPTSIPAYLFNSSYPFAFSNPTQYSNIPVGITGDTAGNSGGPPPQPFLFQQLLPNQQRTDGSNFIQSSDNANFQVTNPAYANYGITNRYFCNYTDIDIQNSTQRQALLDSIRQSMSDHYDYDQGLCSMIFTFAQSYGFSISYLTSLSFNFGLNSYSQLSDLMTTTSQNNGGIALLPTNTYTENNFRFNSNMTPTGTGKNSMPGSLSYLYPKFLSDPILFDSGQIPTYSSRFDVDQNSYWSITEFDLLKYSQSYSPQYLMYNTETNEFQSLTQKACCYGFTGYLLGASLLSLTDTLTSNTGRALYCGNSLLSIGNNSDSPLIAPLAPVLTCPKIPKARGQAVLAPLSLSNLVPLSFTAYVPGNLTPSIAANFTPSQCVVQSGLTKPSLALSGLSGETQVFFDTGIPLKTNYTGDYASTVTNNSRTGNYHLGLWGDVWAPFHTDSAVVFIPYLDAPLSSQSVIFGWKPNADVLPYEYLVRTNNFMGISFPSNGSENFYYSYDSVSLDHTGNIWSDGTAKVQQKKPNLYKNKYFENNAAGFQAYHSFTVLEGSQTDLINNVTSTLYLWSVSTNTTCDAGNELSTLYSGAAQDSIGNFPQQFSYNFQLTMSQTDVNTFTQLVINDVIPTNSFFPTRSTRVIRNDLLLDSYTFRSSSFNSTLDDVTRKDLNKQTGICIDSVAANCPTGSTFELYDFFGNKVPINQTLAANSSYSVRVYEFLQRSVSGNANYNSLSIKPGMPNLFQSACPYTNSLFKDFDWSNHSNVLFRRGCRVIQNLDFPDTSPYRKSSPPAWTIDLY